MSTRLDCCSHKMRIMTPSLLQFLSPSVTFMSAVGSAMSYGSMLVAYVGGCTYVKPMTNAQYTSHFGETCITYTKLTDGSLYTVANVMDTRTCNWRTCSSCKYRAECPLTMKTY